MTTGTRLTCGAWMGGAGPCGKKARYEGHVSEGNWQPVCARHTRGYSYLVPIAPPRKETPE